MTPASLETPTITSVVEILSDLLQRIGVIASVAVEDDEENEVPRLNIRTKEARLLIGNDGTTLSALEQLLKTLSYRKLSTPLLFTLDVDHYRTRRIELARILAFRAAREVVETGKPVELRPMSSYIRRVIHRTLSEHSQVESGSVGEGARRHVVVRPKKEVESIF
ncbi:MAG: hypothetical protein HY459_03300 [Parcubacteria group bacterium]|nr:hypothetical protein [Parcubacteria group bacterium]